MQRILIIGCSGAGKSTFASAMHERLGHELVYLDQYYWRAGWVEPSKEEWEKIVEKLIQKEQWIMDGNYGGTMDQRMAKADTLIFLDRSRWICLWRVLKRTLTYYRQTRPDMAADCPERFSLNFLAYVFHYNDTRRQPILKKLAKLEDKKRIVILKSDRAYRAFLNQISRFLVS